MLTADSNELPSDCHFQLTDLLSHIKQIEEGNIIQLCCLKSCVQSEGAFFSVLRGLDTISIDFMIYCGKLARKIPNERKTAVKFFVPEEEIAKLTRYIDTCLKIFRTLEVC